MEIYKFEREAGLEEKLQADISLNYLVPLEKLPSEDRGNAGINFGMLDVSSLPNRTTAGELDSDLYYNKSVLVSVGWNNNDDVFLPEEVWAARYTPVHKPDNIGHDEKEIVGHMTALWIIDDQGVLVPDNTPSTSIPEKFHVVTSSVIYTTWANEELRKRTDDLINDIESGEMYVSCEAIFRGFNYALSGPNGEAYLIARNEETSFLTKHLRRYQGTGEYEGFKVGRALSNITFSGKGYTKKPANPESVILTPNTKIFAKASFIVSFGENVGVLNNCREKSNSSLENSNMSAETIEKLEAKLAIAMKEITSLNEKLIKADAAKYETTIAELKSTLDTSKSKLTDSEKTIETVKAELSESKKSLNSLEASNKAVLAEKETLLNDLNKVKADSLRISRVAALVDGGISKEDAEKTVDKFISFNDEQFKDISELVLKAAKTEASEDKEDKKPSKADAKAKSKKFVPEEDEDDDEADAEEFDAELDADVSLVTEDEADENLKTLRASLVDFFDKNTKKTVSKK